MTSSEQPESDVLEQRRALRPDEPVPELDQELANDADEADALEQRSPVDDPDDPDEYRSG
ncbi:hypothetical protein GCM10023321_58900 [Pseudonocardia eucalypti]|uniref:Chromosome partitioning protein n=1 Tax=Pseudonocardia eucalypti TaxID=648755 RepID=A0ABP9QSV6_9PSEU|nr:hypothetical protein [Pseudonocardia eucalypti]